MEFKYTYEPVRFEGMISEIRVAFPSLEEFVRDSPKESVDALSASLEAIDENNLQAFAKTLKTSELELIIKIVLITVDSEIVNKAESILKQRFKKKLFDLCWVMLQYNYQNSGLLHTALVLSECMKVEYPEEFAASFLFQVENMEGSLPEKAIMMLTTQNSDLTSFCDRYAILENSDFAQRLRELFFKKCKVEDFVINQELLLKHITGHDINSAALVLSFYLEKLSVREYFNNINRIVVNRWDLPENDGEIWRKLADETVEKFKAWLDLKVIEQHYGQESTRYKLWTVYFDQILQVKYDEAPGLLIMEFENFVVLDEKNKNECSYLYMKDYFAAEYTWYEEMKQQGISTWRINSEHVADARDLVIHNIKSNIYRVGYDNTDILYLKEILAIKLKSATSKKKKENYVNQSVS